MNQGQPRIEDKEGDERLDEKSGAHCCLRLPCLHIISNRYLRAFLSHRPSAACSQTCSFHFKIRLCSSRQERRPALQIVSFHLCLRLCRPSCGPRCALVLASWKTTYTTQASSPGDLHSTAECTSRIIGHQTVEPQPEAQMDDYRMGGRCEGLAPAENQKQGKDRTRSRETRWERASLTSRGFGFA